MNIADKYQGRMMKAVGGITEYIGGSPEDSIRFQNAIIRNALTINDGFECLCNNDNTECALHLERMQIDNCFYIYAYILADDKSKFLDEFFDGSINRCKHQKQSLTTKFLKKVLDGRYRGIAELYDNGNYFVHPSKKHLKALHSFFKYRSPFRNKEIIYEVESSPFMGKHPLDVEWLEKDMCFINDVLIELLKQMNGKEYKETFEPPEEVNEEELKEAIQKLQSKFKRQKGNGVRFWKIQLLNPAALFFTHKVIFDEVKPKNKKEKKLK